ncbi:C1 family peptidase [Virgisporangium aliadipatigenens]|uniref:C1 family peptidase n=1 Tax=Virgisporangium aliadipatigenens TaxID=741659 RepID=UPI0019406717|nr:C1 family peptidase [Virgisporangium aliadipatigenens]
MTSPEESLNAALDAAGHPWQAAENPITQLSEAERRRRLGVPLPDEAERAAIATRHERVLAFHARPRPAAAVAPAAFDARDVAGGNYVTDVRDQGSCGSCVAFGSVSVLETTAAFTRRQPALELNLSEAHLFYAHGKSVGVTCDTGWLPRPALRMAHDIGITYEDYFPYTPGNSGGATLNGDWPNRLARASDVVDLTGKPDRIKEHISTYGAVTACFVVFADFFPYRSGVYRHVTGGEEGGHCVSLVGYDDAQGCWIAKNSWGSGWGDGGFVRIGYGQCEIESWQVVGVTGVRLRAWTGTARVLGLWSDGAERNAWTYLENYGWHRLAGTSDQVQSTMLTQMTAAKVAGRQVNAFTDNGVVDTVYVY